MKKFANLVVVNDGDLSYVAIETDEGFINSDVPEVGLFDETMVGHVTNLISKQSKGTSMVDSTGRVSLFQEIVGGANVVSSTGRVTLFQEIVGSTGRVTLFQEIVHVSLFQGVQTVMYQLSIDPANREHVVKTWGTKLEELIGTFKSITNQPGEYYIWSYGTGDMNLTFVAD